MLALPPIIAELLIPIGALLTALGGWKFALFTKRHAHAEQPKQDC